MISFSQCLVCVHYHQTSPGQGSCAAFPEGIPADLRFNRVAHTSPYPGDHGVLFERMPPATEAEPLATVDDITDGDEALRSLLGQ
jgi:hypothetical protein